MTRGAYHPQRTPDDRIVRLDDRTDGRCNRRKKRGTPYYVRLNDEWFDKLERLLDLPHNVAADTAIDGCSSRADLIEKGFDSFLKIDALARELNYRDSDELLGHMIEGLRFLLRQSAAPEWLSIEQARVAPPLTALPAPKET